MVLTNDEKQKLRKKFTTDAENILNKIDNIKNNLDSKAGTSHCILIL